MQRSIVEFSDATSPLAVQSFCILKTRPSLEKQIQAAKDAETKPMVQASDESTGEAPIAPAMAATPHPSNSLGTINTLDGKTYQDCRLLKVSPDRIVISHSSGITDILFIFLPPELQRRFLINSRPAANFTPAQNQIQQGQKQTADDSSDH